MPTRTTVSVKSGTTTTRTISGGSPSNVYPACLAGTWNYVTSLQRYSLTNTVTTDGPVKDYARKIALGMSATSNLSGERQFLSWTPFAYEDYWTGWPCWRRQSYGVPNIMSAGEPHWAGPATIEAEDAARRALTSDYISKVQRFNGGAAIAEFGDTVRMLQSPVRSLFGATKRFVRAIRRAKPYARSRHVYSRHLADAWLTYSFGAKPLISDIEDAYNALRGMAEAAVDKVNIKGIGRSDIASELRQVSNSLLSYQDVHSRTEYSVRYKGAIKALPPGVGQLSSWFGVSQWDIIPAVWEAIPFSFIVDYFSNAGDMINGLRMCSIDVAWLLRGTKVSNIKFATRAYTIDQYPYVTRVSGGGFYSARSKVTRTDVTSFPFPYQRLHFRTPGFGSMQWLNLAALGRSILESRPDGNPRRGPRIGGINVNDL